jgi:uncharacterized protein (DUF885 family)
MAHTAFNEIQKQMEELAPKVAKEKGYTVTDYRDVIRELKKNQLYGDAILPHYQKRINEIETIIVREKIVTLPEREMRIRIASEAESANTPAPNMRPPRLIGNTGEMGEFVLPLNNPAPAGSKEAQLKYDDFTFEAASWTLMVHEGRPGHELQFASMIETGVSTARAIFAFNSVNVEGWALYAEKVMQPYEPLDGQLIAPARLQRAARVPGSNCRWAKSPKKKPIVFDRKSVYQKQWRIRRGTLHIPRARTGHGMFHGYYAMQLRPMLKAQARVSISSSIMTSF